MSGEPRGNASRPDDPPVAVCATGNHDVDGSGDHPLVRCPYCDRPFRRSRYERLHRGREHFDRLSDRERATVERTVRTEHAEIRRFRLYALGVVVSLYFGLLIVAAFVV